MGLFNSIFKKKGYTDKQLKDATILVSLAQGIAISSYTPLLDKFPDLGVIAKGGQLEKFDFLLTVAGVGVAFSQLTSSVKEKQIGGHLLAVKQALDNWNKSSYSSLCAFVKYIDYLFNNNTIDDIEKFKQAVGAWVFLKLEEDPKSNCEVKQLAKRHDLFKAIGHNSCVTFANYWKEFGVA
ncbi:MAG TPA: hypothetical protein VEV16_02495 [Daejeonella sp.]|nr:hypothetical protein [Daejeonella sp.]